MVVVSYSGKEINAKLVYYGAGLSGKTSNLEAIYEAVPENSRGKMVSMKTQSDRTLFFDLLPLDLGEIMGFKTRFLLYTVPGQVFYNATRKLVLKGADAIVFVADSGVGKMDENKESLENLRANLREYGLQLEEIPWVLQYNKRDLPEVYSIDELNAALNPDGKVPWFEAVATEGKGVFETFRGLSHLLMEKVTRELRRAPLGSRRSNAEPAIGVETPRPEIILPDVPADPVRAREDAQVPGTGGSDTPAQGDDPVTIGHDVQLPEGLQRESASRDQGSSGPEVFHGATVELERSATAATPPRVVPMRMAAGAMAAATTPHLPGLAAAEQAAAEASSAADEIVVPLTIPRGKRHIVLRIVVTETEDPAA